MKKLIKRRMALLLVLALCLSMMSITAFATNEDGEDIDEVDSMGAEVITDVEEIDDCTEDEASVDGIMGLADVPAVSVYEDDPVAEETSEAPVDEPEPESTGVMPLAAVVDSGECGEELTWTLDDDGTLIISGTGDMDDYTYSSRAPWYDYRGEIASAAIEDGVTSIGAYAFSECESLVDVTISDSVTSIGDYAFENTGLITISIPDTVTAMGRFVFSGSSLTYAEIGEGLPYLPYAAFVGCEDLITVDLGTSITEIKSSAFLGCSSLYSIVIPDSVVSIGESAFCRCESLTEVTFGSGLESISAAGFEDCPSLKRLDLPASLTSTMYTTFLRLDGLEWIEVDEGNPVFCSVDGVLYSKDQSELILYPACKSDTSFTIGDSVTTIAYAAFLNTSNLTGVVIPENVTAMEYGAFFGCGSLSQITFLGDAPDSYVGEFVTGTTNAINYCDVTACYPADNETWTSEAMDTLGDELVTWQPYIGGMCGDNLFWALDDDGTLTISGTGDMYDFSYAPWYDYCESITAVLLEDGVTSIEDSAFYSCTGLTEFTIPDSVTEIGGGASMGCTSLTEITIPDSVVTMGDRVFSGSGLASAVVGDGISSLPYGAFNRCESLTSVKLGDGLTEIGAYAFAFCTALTSIVIPDSVVTIDRRAFWGCSSLEEITFGSNLEYIGEATFRECTSLKRLDFPASLTTIDGDYVFHATDALEWIEVDADNQYFCSVDGVLYSKDQSELVHYPSNRTGETYVIGSNVTKIVYGTFRNATNLVTVVIPESVVYLDGAFIGCSNLSQVVFLGNH